MKNLGTVSLFGLVMGMSVSCHGMDRVSTTDGWQVQAGSAVLSADLPWQGVDNQVAVVPFVQAAYGNWTFGLDMLAKYEFKQLGKSELNVFAGINVRDTAYKSNASLFQQSSSSRVFDGYQTPETEWVAVAGANWLWFSLSAEQDISGHSDSQSYQFSIDLPLFQNNRGLMLKAKVGIDYLTQDYVNYYYGVGDDEVKTLVGRFRYQTEAALNYNLSLNLIYPIKNRWALVAEARHNRLDNNIHHSPLVENDSMNNLVLAVTYQF